MTDSKDESRAAATGVGDAAARIDRASAESHGSEGCGAPDDLGHKFRSAGQASVRSSVPWQHRGPQSRELVWRHSHNPVIGRHHLPGAQGIYNSAVVPFGDRFAGVFRVELQTRFPHLHCGWSADGLSWEIEPQPLKFHDASGVAGGDEDYAYDPRVCQIDDTYYVTWCGGHNGPTISLASTKDFQEFRRIENAFLPFNRNGVLFPRLIRGKFTMLSRPSDDGHTPFGDIYISESPDLCHWGRHRLVMRKGGDETGQWWQRTKVGAGPIPIETEEGWLMLYHGVMDTCNGFVYSMGAALLDLDEPAKVRYRTNQHILTPEADYETSGHVPNVVFPCAALSDVEQDRIAIYYGAADTFSCVAYAHLSELVEFTKANSALF